MVICVLALWVYRFKDESKWITKLKQIITFYVEQELWNCQENIATVFNEPAPFYSSSQVEVTLVE